MKKIALNISLGIIFFPIFVNALDVANPQNTASTSPNEYTVCKKRALDKRTKTMQPALKAYLASSTEINKKTQREFDSIRWNLNGSYRENAKKIREQEESEIALANENIAKVRLIAQSTYKAEDSLCDFLQAKASSTPKITKK